MALVLADRVRETSTTTGTGTLTLDGAVASYQSFSAIGDANTTYYTIVNQSANEWEVGIGTYTSSGTTLSRDTVLASSNSGSLVNFSAGTKDVWGDYPAGKAVTTDTLAYPPAIGSTTPAAATFTTLTATGTTNLGTGSASYLQVTGGSTVNLDATAASGNIDLRFSSRASGSIIFRTAGGTTQALVAHTASAVNYVQVTGAATTASPTVSAQGSDSNISLNYNAKGTGQHFFQTAGANTFQINAGGGQANRLRVQSSATGFAPIIDTVGSDTNIAMAIRSTGTGAIDLAAGSSGVNISNGGTVTALTITSLGNTTYTGVPTVAISAPTTAGGVQATASAFMGTLTAGVTITSGGTGYTVGDVLTLSGGTSTIAAVLTVATVSAGVITGITVTTAGNYSALPSNPVSVTGGTGSGATFTILWRLNSLSITNAGSGYVEQPTVTFSGGGGSGAAAYAGIGSASVLRSLAGSGGGSASMSLFTPGGEAVRVTDAGGNLVNYWRIQGAPTSSGVQLTAAGSDANVSALYSSRGTGSQAFFTNSFSQEQFRVSHTASAVNYVNVTGAATGNSVVISSQGSDTNIGMIYNFKGTSSHSFNGNSGTHFQVTSVASGANFLRATGSAANAAPVLSAQGSDTNISMAIQSKGTGAIDLAAGSSGVNISNGGTVTAITRSATGSGYTSIPTVAISAPTTAGGVQATATATMFVSAVSIVSGGTGYTAGDTLTVSGGTFFSAATITVSTVLAGVITAVTVANGGSGYSVLPSNPVSVTGGTGTGATFNVTSWGLSTLFTITNAGSGYVEQPTVSFSGGGGSGAAAYATVGSGTRVQTLGSTMSFYTPGGEQFRVNDNAATAVNYWQATGASTTNFALLTATGSDTNVSGAFVTKGTGSLIFATNATSSNGQFRVSHTASAVNYVQVTGAATGGRPRVEVAGSDTNIDLRLNAKGSGGVYAHAFFVAGAQSFNNILIQGAATGGVPYIQSQGGDTNIDLALTPKGTGRVKFGTYTADMALTVQGYIEILDSGGTVRKLAVIA